MKPRNFLVKAALFKRAGAHKKTNKQLRKLAKQTPLE